MKYLTALIFLFVSCIPGREIMVNGSLLWNKNDLVVCWEDDNSLESSEKDYLRHEVFDKWDKEVALDFIGWKMCSDTHFPDIIIENLIDPLIIDGKRYGGVTTLRGMPINNQPTTIGIEFRDCTFPVLHSGDFKRCHLNNRRLLLHEFGHVMNLLHEQSRKDTPSWCTEFLVSAGYNDQADIEEQEFIGPWSIDGIMNYCGKASIPDVWDILEVQKYYGIETD